MASARDAFRGHLALAVNTPEFAAPVDGCAPMGSPMARAYAAFTDHMLYSAEQMLDVSEGWETTFLDLLTPHADLMCSAAGRKGETDAMSALLSSFRDDFCPEVPRC